MQRSTKIVATLGPASSEPEVLTRMIAAGVDVVRLNFSHGTADDHRRRVALLRETVRKVGRTVGVMVDLQGPKIRVGKFADGKVTLKPGDAFVLDASDLGLVAERPAAVQAAQPTLAPDYRGQGLTGQGTAQDGFSG